MADTVFIATIVAFFVLCGGYDGVCERIIGRDDAAAVALVEEDQPEDSPLERAA